MTSLTSIIAICLYLAFSANAQWHPDDLCPWPSEDETYFSYPGDCTKYWMCFEGRKYLYNCPAGLYFNNKISECDYPENVPNCEQDVTTTSSASSSKTTSKKSTTTKTTLKSTASASTEQSSSTVGFTPDPLCPYPSDTSTYFPVPGDCSKYYTCYEGFKTEMSCPPGLYWNQETTKCDFTYNVDCKNE